jgi:hypothetical protein
MSNIKISNFGTKSDIRFIYIRFLIIFFQALVYAGSTVISKVN